MGVLLPCTGCDHEPVGACARCDAPWCVRHRPPVGRRCRACERDYDDRGAGRNRLKMLAAAPAATLAALLGLGLLLPITGPGLLGSIVVAVGVAAAATITGGALVLGIDRVSRAQFLREHGRELPAARVVRQLGPPTAKRPPS